MTDAADVVVTDGFTGNVTLKTLEGAARVLIEALLQAMTSTDEAKAATKALMPVLAPLTEELDADTYGGAVLLGVEGVCIISHGSSSSRAIFNALGVAQEMVHGGLVEHLRDAIGRGREGSESVPAAPGTHQ
jgi:glycerol-3-phosphate acyltransferase PlsX